MYSSSAHDGSIRGAKWPSRRYVPIALCAVFGIAIFRPSPDTAPELDNDRGRRQPATVDEIAHDPANADIASKVRLSPFDVIDDAAAPDSRTASGRPTESPDASERVTDTRRRDANAHSAGYTQAIDPETGTLRKEEWRDANGELHRLDGPAVTAYRSDGSVAYDRHYVHGILHNPDGPADTGHRSDGSVFSEDYYIDGLRHRDDGPAFSRRRADGSVSYEAYYRADALHRVGAPAVIERRRDSSVSYEAYYANDLPHRADGPAAIWYERSGATRRVQYLLNGEAVNEHFEPLDAHTRASASRE